MRELDDAIERAVGARPVEYRARGGGYSTADRYSVTLADGRRVFVKSSDAPNLAVWLRREHEIYDNLRGSFMPSVEGWDDDGTRPLLALEDLSDADWTPRWDDARVAAVRSALAELAASAPPPRTQPVREAVPGLFGRWQVVADDPAPFLSAGVRSSAWLDEWLPVVLAAADAVPADGDALLHLDVRSDNLCFRDGVALLVDWNWASLGNAELDVGAWLPSLALEGGPDPWEVLPGAGEIAAFMAGIWAAVVGLAPPETAPDVRSFQLRQLEVALAWCEHELGN
ncbi:MAG: aminoglycoside phosphotransferase family protein [Actinomycetota bacterium]|jgi:thiamine kinase-like enzyme|nr:aminoglycoside phosphotransferase family protein [Actinomycetota bacterium]